MFKIDKKLSDNIRQFSYEWIGSKIKDNGTLLDIGTRESKFPAFLSSIGYDVKIVERDRNFDKLQEEYKKEFNTNFEILKCDLLDLENCNFDIITAVYSLQHNIEKDIECYKKCAEICKNQLFIVNEFNYFESRFQRGRNDGDLRIYSMFDIVDRIIKPITKIKKPIKINYDFTKFDYVNQIIDFNIAENSNTIMIEIVFEE